MDSRRWSHSNACIMSAMERNLWFDFLWKVSWDFFVHRPALVQHHVHSFAKKWTAKLLEKSKSHAKSIRTTLKNKGNLLNQLSWSWLSCRARERGVRMCRKEEADTVTPTDFLRPGGGAVLLIDSFWGGVRGQVYFVQSLTEGLGKFLRPNFR